ncbi:hypothetical protein [Marinifilum sp. D737]|uniref:hypothetical protein n=1 Tax=Marinifilum sp. D737 TaxID=2969628 RepID=UPI002274F8DC|nr:hypothetical protein [Marinifilum sp. D737]MCY1634991.1 hypothetical protein [Marinifilum sp. D737]
MHNEILIRIACITIPTILLIIAIHFNLYRKFFYLPNQIILWLQARMLRKVKAVKLLEKDTDFAPSSISDSEEFYLTNGNYEQNYENRNTELPDDILEEKVNCIRNYYNDILNANVINSILLESTQKGIVESLIEAYSFEAIKRNIEKLNRNLSSQNNYQFNGDKLGVYSYEKKNGKVELGLYKTDHFTWLVFKEIYRENKALFDELIFLLDQYNKKSKKFRYIFKCLKYLFSSFGLDISIHGYDSNKKHHFLLCARSGKVEEMKNGLIHVPVNETFSITDYEPESDHNLYCLHSCVKRGIEEEIGYRAKNISNANIEFHDFAIETFNGEIGVSALYTLPKSISIEQLQIYPGQDKYLEMDDLLIVPFPKSRNPFKLIKLVSDENKIKEYVYRAGKMDIASLKWLNFAHLVIQRSILRRLKLSIYGEYFIAALVNIIIVAVLLTWRYQVAETAGINPNNSFSVLNWELIQINGSYSHKIILILEEFIWWFVAAIGLEIGVTIILHNLKDRKNGKRRFKSFKPILPQWHGDVKVIQSTGFVKTNKDANANLGLNFIITDPTNQPEQSISNFHLMQKPYCSIRKEDHNTEYPVSYFPISSKLDLYHDKLFFLLYQLEKYDISKLRVKFQVSYELSQGKIKIINCSFVENLTDLKIKIDSDFNSRDPFFKKCSEQHKDQYQNAQVGKLVIDTKFQLYDLLEYHGDFYWTVLNRPGMDQNAEKIQINQKHKPLYNKIIEALQKEQHNMKKGKNCKTFILEGDSIDVEKALNQFLAYDSNFNRIHPYEIMGLQLALVREDVLIADIQY